MSHTFMIASRRLGLTLFLFAAAAHPAVAGQMLFPDREWGKARLALPQSASRLESLFEVSDDNFEPVDGFDVKSPFRLVASPIGRLDIRARDAYGQVGLVVCTASLISANRVLTNHHCLPGQRGMTVLEARLRLGYLSEIAPGDVYPVNIVPIEADESLDYAVVEVTGRPADKYGVISLENRNVPAGEDLFIIHHPLGKPMQLTRKDCRAVSPQTEPHNIHHRCDTLSGSSGAPIFSQTTRKVVGIHFQGGAGMGSDTYNAGKRLASIITRSALLRNLVLAVSATRPNDDRLSNCATLNVKWQATCGAARKGDATAQADLGDAFHFGDGVKRDDEVAAYWYRRAADQGVRGAQANLGYLYDKGYGVPMDAGRFFYWTERAARAGEVTAQQNLGEAYELGIGVAVNIDEATRWYREAARNGLASASQRLLNIWSPPATLFTLGHTAEKAEQFNDAVYWYDRAARRGESNAMVNLGRLYVEGLGVRRDYAEAARWFREAADERHMVAEFNLGVLYENGWGVRQSMAKARQWYELSARQNYANAKQALTRLGPAYR